MSESGKSGKPELTAEDEQAALQLTKENFNTSDPRTNPYCLGVIDGILHERSAAQARIAELETLISDMFDWCKCGYVHNNRMPVDRGLTILAKAKSIRDKKEVTPQDIRDWLH